MSLYDLLQTAVIWMVLAFSAERALRYVFPKTHRSLVRWLAGRLGRSLPGDTGSVAGGCDSGCGSCDTGCSTPKTVSGPAAEQPVQFQPRRPPQAR